MEVPPGETADETAVRACSRVETAGGRVLGVTARGGDVADSRTRAYAAVAKIRFEGMQYRRDIGARALDR